MARQSQKWVDFVKITFATNKHSVVSHLIEHIEAIELELKISKEDEVEAVRKYGEAEQKIDRLTTNVAQLHAENQKVRQERGEAQALYLNEQQEREGWIEISNQLKEENKLLKLDLEKAQETKTVMIPRDVADAIQSYRNAGHDTDYIVGMLLDISITHPVARLKVLRDYAFKNGFLLIAALLNAYTVEPSKEERLHQHLCSLFGRKVIDNILEVTNEFNAKN